MDGFTVSRTDKTKPWWVRVAEHGSLAKHRHENGICDLPDAGPLAHHNDHTIFTSHCMWDDVENYYGCCHGCGCRLCTGQYYRIVETRAQRHAVRQALTMIRHGSDPDDPDAARRVDLSRPWRRGYW